MNNKNIWSVALKTNGGNPSADQRVVIDDDNNVKTFVSYGTKIAELTWEDGIGRTVTVYPDWNYSRTTMRYFWSFLEQYAEISMNKKLFERCLKQKYTFDALDRTWTIREAKDVV